jgi:hypothetical protein
MRNRIVCVDTTAQRKKTYSGLEVGSQYTFYLFLVNSGGVGALSDPITRWIT